VATSNGEREYTRGERGAGIIAGVVYALIQGFFVCMLLLFGVGIALSAF